MKKIITIFTVSILMMSFAFAKKNTRKTASAREHGGYYASCVANDKKDLRLSFFIDEMVEFKNAQVRLSVQIGDDVQRIMISSKSEYSLAQINRGVTFFDNLFKVGFKTDTLVGAKVNSERGDNFTGTIYIDSKVFPVTCNIHYDGE